MRDTVIDRKFEHFRIDHDEPALFGLKPIEQRGDHGVDANRLTRAGCTGDQQMRHARQIDHHRFAADVLTEGQREVARFLVKRRRGEKLAQSDMLARRVWQFYPDDIAPRDNGNADGNGAHGTRDIVGQSDDAAGLGARRGLQFIERDNGSRPHMEDFAIDAEILQHGFENAGILLQRFLAVPAGDLRMLVDLGQQIERRQLIDLAGRRKFKLGLTVRLGLTARLRRLRARGDASVWRHHRGGGANSGRGFFSDTRRSRDPWFLAPLCPAPQNVSRAGGASAHGVGAAVGDPQGRPA